MKTNNRLTPGLLNRTAKRFEGHRTTIDFARRYHNRSLPTDAVLNLIRREAPPLWELALVVGKWVWIQFEHRQPRHVTAALSEFGFHWNKRRQVWQHPCGTVTDTTPIPHALMDDSIWTFTIV